MYILECLVYKTQFFNFYKPLFVHFLILFIQNFFCFCLKTQIALAFILKTFVLVDRDYIFEPPAGQTNEEILDLKDGILFECTIYIQLTIKTVNSQCMDISFDAENKFNIEITGPALELDMIYDHLLYNNMRYTTIGEVRLTDATCNKIILILSPIMSICLVWLLHRNSKLYEIYMNNFMRDPNVGLLTRIL